MHARLEVISGKAAGMTLDVEDELLIGRNAVGPGRLADDDEISRSHARLSVDSGGFCSVEDLGSTNGTFVNGLRIKSPQTLSEGDTLELGGTTIVVKEVPSPVAPQTPGEYAPQPTVVPGVGEPVDAVGTTPVEEPVEPVGPPTVPAEATPVAPAPAEAAIVPPPGTPALSADDESSSSPEERTEPASAILSLRVEVDFDAREATIILSEGSDPVRVAFEDGVWRQVPRGT